MPNNKLLALKETNNNKKANKKTNKCKRGSCIFRLYRKPRMLPDGDR